MNYAAVISVPLPYVKLGIRQGREALCGIDFLPRDADERAPQTDLAELTADELYRYFDDPGRPFTVPLELHGSIFQLRVWHALSRLPSGATCSYGELATNLGTAPRALGAACRGNPVPVIIPCHRVVSRTGLGGYAGAVDGRQIEIKRWLLEHERQ